MQYFYLYLNISTRIAKYAKYEDRVNMSKVGWLILTMLTFTCILLKLNT